LFDAYLVPKLLSLQLLPFGRSGDVLEELTRGVELFLPLSVRRGQSVCAWRAVRELCVLRVFVVFLLVFVFDPVLFQFFVAVGLRTIRASVADGPGPVRTVRTVLADSPFFPVRLWLFCWLLRIVRGTWPDCPRGPCGLSTAPGRTVCVVSADSPPLLAGQSASASSFAPWFDSSLPSFVLSRVFQGIVTKT
jgi:hypothetical protein